MQAASSVVCASSVLTETRGYACGSMGSVAWCSVKDALHERARWGVPRALRELEVEGVVVWCVVWCVKECALHRWQAVLVWQHNMRRTLGSETNARAGGRASAVGGAPGLQLPCGGWQRAASEVGAGR